VDGQTLLQPCAQVRVDRPWEAQGMPHFGGVGVYRRRIAGKRGGRLWLRLPDTTDAIEVLVDGQSAGRTAWPPYVFELTEMLGEGECELEIRVGNTLGNLITEAYAGSRPPVYPAGGLLAAPQLLLG